MYKSAFQYRLKIHMAHTSLFLTSLSAAVWITWNFPSPKKPFKTGLTGSSKFAQQVALGKANPPESVGRSCLPQGRPGCWCGYTNAAFLRRFVSALYDWNTFRVQMLPAGKFEPWKLTRANHSVSVRICILGQ